MAELVIPFRTPTPSLEQTEDRVEEGQTEPSAPGWEDGGGEAPAARRPSSHGSEVSASAGHVGAGARSPRRRAAPTLTPPTPSPALQVTGSALPSDKLLLEGLLLPFSEGLLASPGGAEAWERHTRRGHLGRGTTSVPDMCADPGV